jgi:DNA-directed RNA polymerase specialized sigma24 family protein
VTEASVNSGLDHAESVIDRMVVRIVCTQAARLAGRHGFSLADRDDIRQELLLDCFVRLRRFDSTKSSRRTFVYRVVRHGVSTLRASCTAACRDYRLNSDSLDGSRWVNGEAIPFGDSVSADHYDCQFGRSVRSCVERTELRIDVDAVIARLPPELAAIARLLASVGAIEAAERLGVPRAT